MFVCGGGRFGGLCGAQPVGVIGCLIRRFRTQAPGSLRRGPGPRDFTPPTGPVSPTVARKGRKCIPPFRSSIFMPTVGLTCAQLSRCTPEMLASIGRHPGLTGASGTACTTPTNCWRRGCRHVPTGACGEPQRPVWSGPLLGSPHTMGGKRCSGRGSSARHVRNAG